MLNGQLPGEQSERCVVCGTQFQSYQEYGFASWANLDGVRCHYGSRYDGLFFPWRYAWETPPYFGPVCDRCIGAMEACGFFDDPMEEPLLLYN